MSLEYSIERLVTLTDEHVKEIADLTAQAFAGDLAWTTLVGGDMSLNTEYCKAELRAAALEGFVYILTIEREGKKKIASWICFFPAGRKLFETEAQRELGFTDLFKKMKPEIQDWYKITYAKYAEEIFSQVFTKEEQKRSHWCHTLATLPEFQNRGYATALVNIAYQKVKESKEEGAFLALIALTTKNVNTSISMGFKDIGEKECPFPNGETLNTHVLIRKPRV